LYQRLAGSEGVIVWQAASQEVHTPSRINRFMVIGKGFREHRSRLKGKAAGLSTKNFSGRSPAALNLA
jgi:hypothetical protein